MNIISPLDDMRTIKSNLKVVGAVDRVDEIRDKISAIDSAQELRLLELLFSVRERNEDFTISIEELDLWLFNLGFLPNAPTVIKNLLKSEGIEILSEETLKIVWNLLKKFRDSLDFIKVSGVDKLLGSKKCPFMEQLLINDFYDAYLINQTYEDLSYFQKLAFHCLYAYWRQSGDKFEIIITDQFSFSFQLGEEVTFPKNFIEVFNTIIINVIVAYIETQKKVIDDSQLATEMCSMLIECVNVVPFVTHQDTKRLRRQNTKLLLESSRDGFSNVLLSSFQYSRDRGHLESLVMNQTDITAENLELIRSGDLIPKCLEKVIKKTKLGYKIKVEPNRFEVSQRDLGEFLYLLLSEVFWECTLFGLEQ